MLLAYSLVGKGFQHSAMRAVSHVTLGEHRSGEGEVKEGFLEVMALEGGGGVRPAKKWSWIGWGWNSRQKEQHG